MKRKFFFKRVSAYLVMMLIPMIILFLALSAVSFLQIDKAIREEGRKTVNAVDTNFNLVLSNVLYQNDLLTGTTRMNISLKRMLNNEKLTYSDSMNISTLRSVLSSIQESHEFIESIYIYLDGARRFFGSEVGIYDLQDAVDVGWLADYEAMEPSEENYITERRLAEGTIRETEVLTVFKRLLLAKGCIVVNINLEKLEDILEKQLSNQEEIILLVNEQGEILADKALVPADLACFEENEWQDALDASEQNWVRVGREYFLLTTERYETMGLYYVSAIPRRALMKNIVSVLGFFLLFLTLDLAVVVFLAYLTTKRSFDQISFLIDMFNEAEKGLPIEKPEKKNRDEYDVIMNNVIYLFLNTNYLKSHLTERQLKQEQAEMMALQLQINPHFLFNTLQTVEIEAREGNAKKEEMCAIIRNVSDILKYALSDPGGTVCLEEEISYLKKYVAVQKVRFGDQFIIYYEVEEELLQAQVFRLFLQPLVENSLLHGIRGRKEKGYIKVSVQRRGEKLRCCVVDSGRGMSRDEVRQLREQIQDETSKGIGVTNLQRRLVLRYGEESALHILSKEQMGTAISFFIPFQELREAATEIDANI